MFNMVGGYFWASETTLIITPFGVDAFRKMLRPKR